MTPSLFHKGSARFSRCRKYRYELRRIWSDGPLAHFCMLNPSTADEINNDPTVERQCRRVQKWNLGYGGVIVTNAFAWRSTDPSALYSLEDPIGPENDHYIVQAAYDSDITICAWGTHAALHGRGEAIRKRLSSFTTLYYLRMSKDRFPCHPLYLPYSLTPKVYSLEQ